MKKLSFNFNSKKGFTLIELLVVIGILAVLAAIAIPSVAGLIDRANVSADSTNANEMTNALERFTSEYELYCQDLASGKVDTDNLDATQGRVYNVTGADDRADIELLEGAGLNGKQINIDTKYPENIATLQAVVENYMKTSSSTFTPKQSDCHFYYSPDCGLVVCTETAESDVEDLNALAQSGKDAKGKDLGASTRWIDVTADVSLSGGNVTSNPALNPANIIPEGATYMHLENPAIECPDCGDYVPGKNNTCYGCGKTYNVPVFYGAGDAFPENPSQRDVFTYGEYEYGYKADYSGGEGDWYFGTTDGWGVLYIGGDKAECDPILESINNIPITSLYYTFAYNLDLAIAPAIPSTVTNMENTFCFCQSLTTAPEIPNGVTNMLNTFELCSSLTIAPEIPSTVTNMDRTFAQSGIAGSITIHANPEHYYSCLFRTGITTVTGDTNMASELLNTR